AVRNQDPVLVGGRDDQPERVSRQKLSPGHATIRRFVEAVVEGGEPQVIRGGGIDPEAGDPLARKAAVIDPLPRLATVRRTQEPGALERAVLDAWLARAGEERIRMARILRQRPDAQ